MITLPEEYQKNSYTMTLLEKKGPIGLYAQNKKGHTRTLYEVIIARRREETTIQGRKVPAGTKTPSNEEWGRKGWTYETITNARNKYAKLTNT